jgi:hypothetical protein
LNLSDVGMQGYDDLGAKRIWNHKDTKYTKNHEGKFAASYPTVKKERRNDDAMKDKCR